MTPPATDTRPMVAAVLLRRGAVLVAGASVLLVLILASFTVLVGNVVLDSVRMTLRAVESLEETVALAESLSNSVQQATSAAARGVDAAAGSTDDLVNTLDRVAQLASEDLPQSLEAVDEAMPALIEAGGVIDGTLRALSLIGVDYSPEVPFDEALREVDESLEGLPAELRAEGEAVSDLVPAVEEVGGDLQVLSRELSAIQLDVDRVAAVVGSYRETAEEARDVVQGAETLLDVGRWVALAGLVAVGVAWLVVARMLWRAAGILEKPPLE